LDELVLLIQHHMANIMTQVAISADVTGLATVVAGLREGFESPSMVDVHRDACKGNPSSLREQLLLKTNQEKSKVNI
jgi:hypothetical protein